VTRHISVTFDYRCPFARNANEAVVAALRSDALADVEWRFVPFSLDQSHLEEGEVPVWEQEPAAWGTGVLALLYGIAVRDAFPDRFLDAHVALFAARYDQGRKLDDEAVLRDVVASVGLDADRGGGRGVERPAVEDLDDRASAGGRRVGRLWCPDVRGARRGGLRAVHGPRPGRRPGTHGGAARLDPLERVQAHATPPLTPNLS
jgi:hypothetical protein